MPAIIEAKCNLCDYRTTGSQSASYAILENGQEEVLPHPCEQYTAKTLTGKTIRELSAEHRIKYKYGLICRHCGVYDLYETSKELSFGGHVGSIVGTISPNEADAMTCRHCGNQGMQSVMGEQIGCLSFLLGKRPAPNIFTCPKCHKGTVEIAMIGIS